jgi:bifunctional non-homologous end joining protein LigD
VRTLAQQQRRQLLNDPLKNAQEPIHLSTVLEAAPDALIRAVREQGLEGIIAKRSGRRYESGERSGQWVKYRVNRGQELAISGYWPRQKLL